jgi:putative nucleotidyltransferase with HDIG domain
MLQSAELARREGASASLVTAALLHDVGHLIHRRGEDIAERGIDARHESIGADWLARQGFPEAVVEPIRLHVAAKRFLCHEDGAYGSSLSEASRQSLELQGGPMSASEAREFRKGPFAEDAIRLRAWDDGGKDVDATTLSLDTFHDAVLESLAPLEQAP